MIKPSGFFSALALTVLLSSCGQTQSSGPTSGAQQIEWRLLGEWQHCPAPADALQAQPITIAEAQQLSGGSIAEGHSLILVQLGEKPNGGYRLTLNGASFADSTVHLNIDISSPQSGQMVTQALTSPCLLAELPLAEINHIVLRAPSGQTLRTQSSPWPALPEQSRKQFWQP